MNETPSREASKAQPKVLLLSPVKNAADLADTYCRNLENLSYPHELLSLGLLESDSRDGSQTIYRDVAERLGRTFRRTGFWKKDFNFRMPPQLSRWLPQFQSARRSILAKSRNHLLFHALDDEDWVLWLDVDVIEYPHDLIQTLLSYDKDILQPHCVLEYGGPTFDMNAWRDHGRYSMDDLRDEGEIVPLDAVGGTVLLVRADLHRDGLIFPPYFYGERNARARLEKEYIDTPLYGEIETEGLGIMASDMGALCWGLPHLEVKHRNK